MTDSQILIVGCSYVENLDCVDPVNPNCRLDRSKIVLKGTSGAGNQSIAARVIYECSMANYDHVYVLWSGINRLDFPIGRDLHQVQPTNKHGNPRYQYWSDLGEMIWYHSGGYRLSGTSDDCPKWLREFYDHQYKSATPRYLTDLTLLSVIQTQAFLKSKNISCSMSFIYDVHKNYTETHIEPGCGKLDSESPLNTLIDWNMFGSSIAPFEFAVTTNQLEPDCFHPRFEAMQQWFAQQFGLELLAKQ